MPKGSVVRTHEVQGSILSSVPGLGTGGGGTDDRMGATGRGKLIRPGLSYRSYSPSSQRTHHKDGSSFNSCC